MFAIETKNLTRKFKDRTAVDALNLSVEQGAVYALLGLNGAGKTTTIKMLCCLLPPSEGDAFLLGDSIVKNSDAVKRKINVSPQETAVAKQLSVKENLELMAQIYGCDKKTAVQKTEKMLERFHLSDRKNDKAKVLSGGLMRKLSIAMALISEPEIIFLDEPTLGLDVRARRDLWQVIERLKGEMTVILTTHYLEEAQALADKIGIMEKGQLITEGTAEEIMRETETETLEDAFLKITEVQE